MKLRLASAATALLLAACASHVPPAMPHPSPASPPEHKTPSLSQLPPAKPEQIPQQYGGYYKDDGPILDVPYDLDALPEPDVVAEPLNRYANRPYRVLGKTYTPRTTFGDFSQEGIASWYGKKFHGKRTSSGETYDLFKLTAAHPTLPIPSYARVTSLETGKSVLVRVNDRGPFHKSRVIDLSYAAAYRLGYHNGGSGRVRVEAVAPGDNHQASAPEVTAPVLPTAAVSNPPQPVVTGADPLAKLLATTAPATEPVAQPTALPPAPSPLPIEAAADQRWVQLGAFGTQTTAEAFRARLPDTVSKLAASPVVEAAGNIWRVRIGPFASRQDAQQAADRIAASGDLKPVVMR